MIPVLIGIYISLVFGHYLQKIKNIDDAQGIVNPEPHH